MKDIKQNSGKTATKKLKNVKLNKFENFLKFQMQLQQQAHFLWTQIDCPYCGSLIIYYKTTKEVAGGGGYSIRVGRMMSYRLQKILQQCQLFCINANQEHYWRV